MRVVNVEDRRPRSNEEDDEDEALLLAYNNSDGEEDNWQLAEDEGRQRLNGYASDDGFIVDESDEADMYMSNDDADGLLDDGDEEWEDSQELRRNRRRVRKRSATTTSRGEGESRTRRRRPVCRARPRRTSRRTRRSPRSPP